MPKKPKAIVLDSWAVIAFLEGEPAAEKVADIISDAHEQGIPLLMTVVNAGEVWYIVAREASASDADASIKQLRDLGIEFEGTPGPLNAITDVSGVEVGHRHWSQVAERCGLDKVRSGPDGLRSLATRRLSPVGIRFIACG